MDDVVTGHRAAEQHAELGYVGQGPGAELPAGGNQLDRHHLGLGELRAGWPGGGVNRGPQVVGDLGEDIGDDVPQQLFVAAEVAVEGRRSHAHLAGDGTQRHIVLAVLDQQPPRRLDDLLGCRGPEAITPAGRLNHAQHPPPPLVRGPGPVPDCSAGLAS